MSRRHAQCDSLATLVQSSSSEEEEDDDGTDTLTAYSNTTGTSPRRELPHNNGVKRSPRVTKADVLTWVMCVTLENIDYVSGTVCFHLFFIWFHF